nr:myosin-17-like [Tanacetum cinerariifolium]
MWKEKHEQHRLDEIIFQDLKQQMDATSLEIFADIAYQCLRESRKQRPTMSQVVEKLDIPLQVQEEQELLIKCIKQDLGFSSGKPVAAYLTQTTIKVERTTIFERITQTTITLATETSSSTSLFGRMSQILWASWSADKTDGFRQVEARYPALSFKKQLTDLLMNIYGMIRDNIKKELSPFIDLCIQAPRTSQTMKAKFVTPFLVRKVFKQIFWFINFQLFNSLLLRRECCSFKNGEYLKAGLAELEEWCYNATEEYAGTAWDELKHIRQAVPKNQWVLSIQQLYRISTMYMDDKYGTHTVSSELISNMRVMMTKDMDNGVSSSLLLDDDSSIPLSVDDISKYMPQVDTGNIELPPLIREHSGFEFLHQRTE